MTEPRKSTATLIREALGPRRARPVRDDPVRVDHAAKPARRPKPAQRVDALAGIPVFSEVKESRHVVERGREFQSHGSIQTRDGGSASISFSDEVIPKAMVFESKARPATRGADDVIAKLARLGVRFTLTPSGEHVVVVTEKGAMPAELRVAIEASLPLVHARLIGEVLGCSWCEAEAETILLGGAPACPTHAAEAVPPPPEA